MKLNLKDGIKIYLKLNFYLVFFYFINLLNTSSFPNTFIISYKSGVFNLPVNFALITELISPTCPGHFSGSAFH